jgi:hypothetical protein
LAETGKDLAAIGRSLPVRIAAGIATGGWSEMGYQGLSGWEAMQHAADDAMRNGKNMDWNDFVRAGLQNFGRENLPINTYNNLVEGKTDLWSMGTGVLGDAFAVLNIKDSGASIIKSLDNIPNVRSGRDLLDALHHGENIKVPDEPPPPKTVPDDPAQPGKPWDGKDYTKAPPGTEVPLDRVKDFGLDPAQIKHAQEAAAEAGAHPVVRPAGPEGIGWRAEGNSPKPEFLKNKTINDLDTYLGADPANKGLVGSFPPKVPDPDDLIKQIMDRNGPMHPDDLNSLVKKIETRAAQRLDEFADQELKLSKLSKSGQAAVENGVVIDKREFLGIDPNTGNQVPNPGYGKGFTADLDLWSAVDNAGGPPALGEKLQLFQNLKGGEFDAQHGAHTDWTPVGTVNTDIDAVIRANHQPGGQGLLEIKPDGTMTVKYAEPFVTPAQQQAALDNQIKTTLAQVELGMRPVAPPPPPSFAQTMGDVKVTGVSSGALGANPQPSDPSLPR